VPRKPPRRRVPRRALNATARPALDAFAVFLDQSGLGPRTVDFYRHDVERFLGWLHDDVGRSWRWKDVTELAVERFRAHLSKEAGLGPSSVNRALHALRRFCRWAAGRKLLTDDPTTAVVTPRPPARLAPPPLTDEQIEALLPAAGCSRPGPGKRNFALFMLMLETGLRGEDLVALTMGSLKLTARSGSLRVPVLDSPPLDLPLTAPLRRALPRYLATRLDEAPEAPLFISKRVTPLSLRALQVVIREVARRAKVVDVSPHRLRHTFAARFLAEHPDKIWDLADRLGLQSTGPLMRYLPDEN